MVVTLIEHHIQSRLQQYKYLNVLSITDIVSSEQPQINEEVTAIIITTH